jgi:hypothetical protein
MQKKPLRPPSGPRFSYFATGISKAGLNLLDIVPLQRVELASLLPIRFCPPIRYLLKVHLHAAFQTFVAGLQILEAR